MPKTLANHLPNSVVAEISCGKEAGKLAAHWASGLPRVTGGGKVPGNLPGNLPGNFSDLLNQGNPAPTL